MSQAEEFLSRIWPAFDGSEYLNVCWTTAKADGKGVWFNGRATQSMPEALNSIRFAQNGREPAEIYAGLSSQRDFTPKVSKTGHAYKQALRTQDNVVSLRVLFMDIDVDAEKAAKGLAYATTKDAQVGLIDFLRKSSMPVPTITVMSGSGGMHVYWCLDRALTRAEWQPLAEALMHCAQAHGLRADHVCTRDSARVLRIPGTINHKRGQNTPVTMLKPVPYDWTVESISEVLAPYTGPQAASPAAVVNLPARTGPMKAVSDLAAGVGRPEARPVSLSSIALKCAFIRDTLADHGASNPEPLWRSSLHVALFTENPQASAHELSKGHPGYDHDETEAKLAALQLKKDTSNFGYPRCTTIQNAGCQSCATCPHFTQDFSPVRLGVALVSQIIPLNELPDGYVRGADGHIYARLMEADGTEQRIELCPYPIVDGWLQTNPYTLNFAVVLENGKSKQIQARADLFGSRDGISKILFAQGLFLHETQAKNLRSFLVAWLQKLQRSKDRVVDSHPFGWHTRDGKVVGFIYGKNYQDDGNELEAANPDPEIQRQYTPQGSMDLWLACSKLITDQKRPELDAILASAFGAPLARFSGEKGMYVNAWSAGSGVGKSTAIRVALAVWADHATAKQGLSDTVNSVFGRLGSLKHLPIYWDEIKQKEDMAKLVRVVFQLAEGKEKSRMNGDGTLRAVQKWNTLMVSATNESLVDPIVQQTKNTTAGLFRVFEFQVPLGKVGQIEQSDAARMTEELSDNYGHAGKVYAKFLGTKHQGILQLFKTKQIELAKKVKATADERLWIATMTCLIMGAKFANRLSLTEIDEPALETFLITTLGKMRAIRVDQPVDMSNKNDLATVFQSYLSAMRARNTLQTDKIYTAPGRVPPNSVKIYSDLSRLDTIMVQHAVDTDVLRLKNKEFREWLIKNDYSPTLICEALAREFGAKTVKAHLGNGTPVRDQMQGYLLEIDLTDIRLQGLTW